MSSSFDLFLSFLFLRTRQLRGHWEVFSDGDISRSLLKMTNHRSALSMLRIQSSFTLPLRPGHSKCTSHTSDTKAKLPSRRYATFFALILFVFYFFFLFFAMVRSVPCEGSLIPPAWLFIALILYHQSDCDSCLEKGMIPNRDPVVEGLSLMNSRP